MTIGQRPSAEVKSDSDSKTLTDKDKNDLSVFEEKRKGISLYK